MSCKYKEIVKCAECTHIYHQECTLFQKAHLAWLTRSIRPFVKTTIADLHSSVIWSKNMNLAKSVATQYAVYYNSPVIVLNTTNLITEVMKEEEPEDKVFFIDISKRGQWKADDQTIKCLQTFISRCNSVGACVAIYISPATGYRLTPDDAKEIK